MSLDSVSEVSLMSTDSELEQLLQERFKIGRADLLIALKTLPAVRPWATTLTADEARLLDSQSIQKGSGRT
jgi:hypothetical protein